MSNEKYDRQAYRDGHKDGYWAAEQHIMSWLRNFADKTYTFTAKKFADHIEHGSHHPAKVVCDKTNNSLEDIAARDIDVDLVAMNPDAVVVAKCSHENCQEPSIYAVQKQTDAGPVYTCYCEKHYEGNPPDWICSYTGCLAPADYGVMGENDDITQPLCAKHAFPDDTGKRF